MEKIMLDGVDNAREFGGTPTEDGRVVRHGLFIRSNHLGNMSEEDARCLSEQYHVKKIIDLRTDTEVCEKRDCEVSGARWMHIPLFEETAVGITHEKSADITAFFEALPDMGDLYRRIVTDDFSVSQLQRVMEEILDMEDGAVLWHCTEGKDRCGIVSALTQELLGVRRELIYEDYLATNKASAKRAEAFYQLVLEKTEDGRMAENAKRMFLADEAYLKAAFDAIEKEDGSVEQFFIRRLGIGEEQRRKFRNHCLE